MKKLLDAIQEKMNEVDNLEVLKRTKIITFLFSFLFGLLTVIGFIGIIVNLAILDQKLIKLYVFLIATLILISIFVTLVLYYNGISKGRVKGLYKIYLFDIVIIATFIYIIMLIMFMIGVF
jgi:hypothetical protein